MKIDQGTVTISGQKKFMGLTIPNTLQKKKVTYKFKFDEQTDKIILQ